jgi:hypothetical protein
LGVMSSEGTPPKSILMDLRSRSSSPSNPSTARYRQQH